MVESNDDENTFSSKLLAKLFETTSGKIKVKQCEEEKHKNKECDLYFRQENIVICSSCMLEKKLNSDVLMEAS